jgi:serine/threonine-protein kinase
MRRCPHCNSFFDDSVQACPYDDTATEEVDFGVSQAHSLEGSTISARYEVGQLIGAGGMGMVHKAVDTRTGETIAIKILHKSISGDPRTVKRFFSEARVLSSLSHPNIIRFTEFGNTEEGQLFIAMEFIDGTPLDELIDNRAVTLEDAITITDQAAAALGEAHLQGVIHRDLKPANLFARRGEDGGLRVTVLDFGIAKVAGGKNLTATGKVMGTPSYMAPEQIRGGEPGPGTDIYALGALAYELIAGSPPFTAENAIAVMFMHLEETPTPLSTLDLPIPVSRELSDALATLLAKAPEDRPKNMRAVRKLLAPFTSPTAAAGLSRPNSGAVRSDLGITLARATRDAPSTTSLPTMLQRRQDSQQDHAISTLPQQTGSTDAWRWWLGTAIIALVLASVVAAGVLIVAANASWGSNGQQAATAEESK